MVELFLGGRFFVGWLEGCFRCGLEFGFLEVVGVGLVDWLWFGFFRRVWVGLIFGNSLWFWG